MKEEFVLSTANKYQRFCDVCVCMHAQTTQNNKFAIPLQYLIKEVSDKVGFLPTDKMSKFSSK